MPWQIEERSSNLWFPTIRKADSLSELIQLLRELASLQPCIYSLEVSDTVELIVGLSGTSVVLEQFDYTSGQAVAAYPEQPVVSHPQRFKSHTVIVEVSTDWLFPLDDALVLIEQSCEQGRLPESLKRRPSPDFPTVESL